MADSPLFDAPTCKSKVRDCTRCTVTRTRITNDRKRSSKTMIDENEKIKKKKGKKKIYDPARRASEQPWNATNVEEEYAVIATGWNEQVLC